MPSRRVGSVKLVRARDRPRRPRQDSLLDRSRTPRIVGAYTQLTRSALGERRHGIDGRAGTIVADSGIARCVATAVVGAIRRSLDWGASMSNDDRDTAIP